MPFRRLGDNSGSSLPDSRSDLLRDGVLAATGHGANVLGGPVNALDWLLRGLPSGLRTGEIVTTGTVTEALPVEPGQHWKHRLTTSIDVEPAELTLL